MPFTSLITAEPITVALVFLFTILASYSFFWKRFHNTKYKFPEGPTPLPVLGNLHILNLRMPHETLHKLSDKYGSVYTFHMGPKKVLVLCGYEAVKEALVNQADDFGDRGETAINKKTTKGNGILFGRGESWRTMRRFTLSTLRDFGMGKRTIENRIVEESQKLLEVFETHKGEPFNPRTVINSAVSNIICSIVYGERFDYNDAQFLHLQNILRDNIRLATTPKSQFYNMYPILGIFLSDHKKVIANYKEFRRFNLGIYDERKDKVDSNDLKCFIDAFIVKRQEEESKSTKTYFHEDNMAITSLNLFGAGTETTSTTLRWGLLLMMKYPEVQAKVHQEIESVIGKERNPQANDRKHMPYTEAVLHEIQRFSNVVPMGIPHQTAVDTTFRGYTVPKGTPVITLLTSVLYDKTQWATPHQFNVNHFLDDQGKFITREAFLPFSAGRRVCLGEKLAKMELFLFFTMLLQKFVFRPPPGVTLEQLDLSPMPGLTLSPQDFKLCAVFFRKRFQNTKYKFPEGPSPLPVLGNLHILDLRMPHETLHKLADKYGSVYTFHMGPKRYLVLCGYEALKEALIDQADDFGDRYEMPINKDTAKGHGIIFSSGESWKTLRRFTISTLREFGMGKRTIEYRIVEECQKLLEVFESHKGEPFDPRNVIISAVSNIICSIVFGERFDYKDLQFLHLINIIHENFKLATTPQSQLYNTYPFLGFFLSDHKKNIANYKEIERFILSVYHDRKDKVDNNDLRGFIDAFIVKWREEETKCSKTYFNEDNMVYTSLNLFGAATETTSTTLRWGLLLMMKYPEVQEKVRQEIETVIGKERNPQVNDRKHMPYTDAVLHEIQRFSNVAPMGVLHQTSVDTTFQGYTVPKGTPVITLLTSALYDKTQWATPYQFNVNHFLDDQGKFIKRAAFLPFSAGRRVCLGETLAKTELFLFFTMLLQKFVLQPPSGVTPEQLDLSPVPGLTLSPQDFKLCAVCH
ncbi:CP2K1 protein, partial [Polypterus senegalus]